MDAEFIESEHPRNEYGEFAESSSSSLASAVEAYTQGDATIGSEIAQLVKKGLSPDPESSSSAAILHGIRNGKKFNNPVYRGLWITDAKERTLFDKLKAGKTFDVKGATSFTQSEDIAALFASESSPTNPFGKGQSPTYGRGIIIEAENVQGIDVEPMASEEYKSQKEVLTNGVFRVKSMSWKAIPGERANRLHIKVEQERTQ
jgi:hypothetical protein